MSIILKILANFILKLYARLKKISKIFFLINLKNNIFMKIKFIFKNI